LLQRVADEQLNLHLVIDRQFLHGGDPLAIVEGACQKAQERARNHGGFYARAVLLDADKLGQAPDRDSRIQALADAEGFLLVWQRPAHPDRAPAKNGAEGDGYWDKSVLVLSAA
jgi:NADPH:quinone reductase-like Zn-dependent oxidoreductase